MSVPFSLTTNVNKENIEDSNEYKFDFKALISCGAAHQSYKMLKILHR